MTDRDRLGRTAVLYAAGGGDVDGLRALLAEGAGPGAVDAEGWTPLHFMAYSEPGFVSGYASSRAPGPNSN